jgi:hypothetical protein
MGKLGSGQDAQTGPSGNRRCVGMRAGWLRRARIPVRPLPDRVCPPMRQRRGLVRHPIRCGGREGAGFRPPQPSLAAVMHQNLGVR